MRIKPIFICAFSIISLSGYSQKNNLDKEDTIRHQYKPNFIIGMDILNLGTGFFSERQLVQGFVSSKIKPKVHAVADIGFDKNRYDKNGYDVEVSGFFAKAGAFYMLSVDKENTDNGFYVGGKLAATFYNQEYKSVPVKGANNDGVTLAFDKSSQSSYWIEAMLGARIQIFDTRFFIDMNVQPKYLFYTTKQEEIIPMIVPGFGNSSGKFNIGFSWNLAYKF